MLKFEKLPWKIDDVFIGSDFHLDHKNICSATSDWSSDRGCRDFQSLEEMNDLIIDNINEKVSENSLLIELGDFSFQGEANIPLFRNRIKCKNVLAIRGNHDQHITKFPELFLDIKDLAYYQVESLRFVCCHFPILHYHEQNTGAMMLHGHLHSHGCDELKSYQEKYKIQDVGIDVYKKLFGSYNVFSLRELNTLLKDKQIIERHV